MPIAWVSSILGGTTPPTLPVLEDLINQILGAIYPRFFFSFQITVSIAANVSNKLEWIQSIVELHPRLE